MGKEARGDTIRRRMKIIEPVLFPFTSDELENLRIASNNWIKDYDIYIHHNYLKIHYQLLEKYIDPELTKICQNEIDNTIIIIRSRPFVYQKYLKYFLCMASREKGEEISKEEFQKWLGKNHDFTYRIFKKPNLVYNIIKIYNTIIIPKIPEYSPLDNYFNRIHDLPSNYYDSEYIAKRSVDHLVEGGQIIIFDRDSLDKFWNYLPLEGYEQIQRRPYIIQKEIKPKKKIDYTKKNWL